MKRKERPDRFSVENLEKKEKELREFFKIIAENLREEGIPTTDDCRIDINGFVRVYTSEEIERDQKEIQDLEQKFKADEELRLKARRLTRNPEEILESEEGGKIGEKLELLKTAIFSKFLGKRFIVVRSSRYDDIKNNVDNIILDKETGSLICAFDEVSETSGPLYEQKKQRTLSRNKKGGAMLKYGFRLEDRELKLGRVENVPIFLIALPPQFIEEGIKNFSPSFDTSSDYERKLFEYLIQSLKDQTAFLELEQNLNPQIQNHIRQFKKFLENF